MSSRSFRNAFLRWVLNPLSIRSSIDATASDAAVKRRVPTAVSVRRWSRPVPVASTRFASFNPANGTVTLLNAANWENVA